VLELRRPRALPRRVPATTADGAVATTVTDTKSATAAHRRAGGTARTPKTPRRKNFPFVLNRRNAPCVTVFLFEYNLPKKDFFMSGQLPSEICHLLYGASLCALHKKDGGIRPIAIGNFLRRLTSKLACFQSRNFVNSYLSPHQLRVATKLGCEAAIHTTRTFVNNDQNRGKVLLKLDFKNAFNSVERDCFLKEVECHMPLLYLYLYQCYRNPSTLIFGNHLISSSV
jgi:hypothetical protein